MISGKLATEEYSNSSAFPNAQFVVVNISEKRNEVLTKSDVEAKAIEAYFEMPNDATRVYVASYAGCKLQMDNEGLFYMFKEWISEKTENPRRFLKELEYYSSSKEAKAVVELTFKMQKLAKEGKISKIAAKYNIKGKEFATTIKETAKMLIKNPTEYDEELTYIQNL